MRAWTQHARAGRGAGVPLRDFALFCWKRAVRVCQRGEGVCRKGTRGLQDQELRGRGEEGRPRVRALFPLRMVCEQASPGTFPQPETGLFSNRRQAMRFLSGFLAGSWPSLPGKASYSDSGFFRRPTSDTPGEGPVRTEGDPWLGSRQRAQPGPVLVRNTWENVSFVCLVSLPSESRSSLQSPRAPEMAPLIPESPARPGYHLVDIDG